MGRLSVQSWLPPDLGQQQRPHAPGFSQGSPHGPLRPHHSCHSPPGWAWPAPSPRRVTVPFNHFLHHPPSLRRLAGKKKNRPPWKTVKLDVGLLIPGRALRRTLVPPDLGHTVRWRILGGSSSVEPEAKINAEACGSGQV